MSRRKSKGFTLIEIVVVIAILSIIAAIAVPSFRTMILNAEGRAAAESILNGLQHARTEAVTRNARVEFVVANDTSWNVQLLDGTDLLTRISAETSANVSATSAGATTATFNSFGMLVNNADASNQLLIVNVSATGGSKTLRVVIGSGGSVRMCDPGLTSGSSAAAC